jgi:ribose transport system ATP-binding protein
MTLLLNQITKSYGPNQVLRGVDLRVTPGRVHSLLGANGAGKSTLLKVLTGASRPDSGTFTLNGAPVKVKSPAAARRVGISMVHQEITLLPHQNAVRNVTLAALETRCGLIRRARQEQRARQILSDVGFRGSLTRPVRQLSVGQLQLVEIAKALMLDAAVLALDEPTAALSPSESEHLFRVVGQLRERGTAIIYVSHRLDEVVQISDDISVLRDGAIVARYSDSDIANLNTRQLVEDMMGMPYLEATSGPRSTAPDPNAPVLQVRNLRVKGAAATADLVVHRGEIVGIFGLVGAGRTELLRAIFGADPADGEVLINGKPRGRGPSGAIAAGMAFLPEERKAQGLLLRKNLSDNVMLPFIHHTAGLFRRSRQETAARAALQSAHVSKSARTLVGSLSGGNQQKVLLARWMVRDFDVYLFDEPTRGIDVATKDEIYQLLEGLAARGAAILVVSSESEEIFRLSHRCLVMHESAIVMETRDLSALTEADLVAAASNVAPPDAGATSLAPTPVYSQESSVS